MHVCCIAYAALQVCLQDLCRNPRRARGGAEGHKRGVNCGDRRRGLGQCWRMKGRARSIRVDGRCGEGRPAKRGSARMHSCVGFLGLLGPSPAPPRSRAKSSYEGRARGLCGEIVWQCVVRRASWGWCGARGAAQSGCVPAAVQEDGRRSEGSEDEMQ